MQETTFSTKMQLYLHRVSYLSFSLRDIRLPQITDHPTE